MNTQTNKIHHKQIKYTAIYWKTVLHMNINKYGGLSREKQTFKRRLSQKSAQFGATPIKNSFSARNYDNQLNPQ